MSPINLRGGVLTALVLALTACGGTDDAGSSQTDPPPPPATTVQIGGTVSGLTGTLVLRNNGANDLNIASDGAFTFSTSLATGVAYTVSIATQPANQTCTVTNGTGTTAAANITNVAVTCAANAVPAPSALSYPSPQSYAVGAAITPLNPTVTGTVTSYSVLPALPAGLALNTSTGQITGTPSAASAAANFVITAANSGGSTTFSLAITVTAAAAGNFTIGGTVTGLNGKGLVLRNNGGNDLTVTASGAVTFSSRLATGTAYAVVVKTQPVLPGQICTVTNGKGTVGSADVTNVAIDCVGSTFADTDRDGLTDEVEATLGTDPTKVDSDGDTLGDGEEVLLRGTDPLNTHTDGDAVSDNTEVANGTAPNNFDTDGDLLDDGVDPYPWRADGDGDGVADINDPSPLLRDADGGGASDGAELAAGTNPFSPGDDRPSIDTDHDLLTDNDEVALGTDLSNPDSDGDRTLDGLEAGACDPLKFDTDEDTLKDSTERAANLICDQPDSDHDGLADNEEVGPSVADQDGDGLIDGVEERVYHSFSGVNDTDNDGLNDGDEVRLRLTDPISADTDCDGTNDGQEVSNGTDPLHGPNGSTCSI